MTLSATVFLPFLIWTIAFTAVASTLLGECLAYAINSVYGSQHYADAYNNILYHNDLRLKEHTPYVYH